MPKWDEQTIKRHLDKEPEQTPDYDGMWSRIQREVDNRRSGWSRDDQPKMKQFRSQKRGRRGGVIALGVVAAIGIGVLGWQYNEQSIPIQSTQQASYNVESAIPHAQDNSLNKSLPITKNLNIESVQNGVGLRLNTGRFNVNPDGIESLTLNFSLFGIDKSTFDYASFVEGDLVNAGNGSDVISTLNGFDKAKNYFADETFSLNESANIMDKQQYLVKFKDLVLIKHHNLKLPSNMQTGKQYTIHPGEQANFLLHSLNWSDNHRKLTLRYSLDQSVIKIPDNDQFHKLQAMNKLVLRKNGELLDYSSSLTTEGDIAEQQFDFNTPMVDDQQDIDFYFDYANIVQTLDGQWTISFSMDE
ncbi:hypothetical protein ACE3MZ_07180 [Paenibacillus sp. WLX1005]|uniref:hypothetical protein n=1 Tax=Paenibacillus sp. WLX1005 TaxID=3243766 RepID=UPI00398430C5